MSSLKMFLKARVITIALFFTLLSNIVAAQQYFISTPELRQHFNKTNKNEVYYIIIDFNDCFNCTQSLRFINHDSSRSVFVALINFPSIKIPSFEKEYKLKFNPIYLDNASVETLGLKQYKKYLPQLNSFMIKMSSESIVELNDFRKFNSEKTANELLIVDSLAFKDTFFYSSFYNTSVVPDGYVTILSPKNIAAKYNKTGAYVRQLNLDNFYLSDEMFNYIKSQADSMLGESTKLDLISNYMTYAKPYGYNSHMISNSKVLQDTNQILFVVNFTVVYSKGDKARIMFYPALVKTDYDLNIKSIDWIKLEQSGDFYGLIPYDFFLKENSLYCQSITFNNDYYQKDFTYYPFFRATKKADLSNVYDSKGIDSSHFFKINALKWNIKSYPDIQYKTINGQYLLFNSKPLLYNIKEKKLLELGFEKNLLDTGAYSSFYVLHGSIDKNNNLDYCFYYNKKIYILKIEIKNETKIIDYHVLKELPKGTLIGVIQSDNNYIVITKDLNAEMKFFQFSSLIENKR